MMESQLAPQEYQTLKQKCSLIKGQLESQPQTIDCLKQVQSMVLKYRTAISALRIQNSQLDNQHPKTLRSKSQLQYKKQKILTKQSRAATSAKESKKVELDYSIELQRLTPSEFVKGAKGESLGADDLREKLAQIIGEKTARKRVNKQLVEGSYHKQLYSFALQVYNALKGSDQLVSKAKLQDYSKQNPYFSKLFNLRVKKMIDLPKQLSLSLFMKLLNHEQRLEPQEISLPVQVNLDEPPRRLLEQEAQVRDLLDEVYSECDYYGENKVNREFLYKLICFRAKKANLLDRKVVQLQLTRKQLSLQNVLYGLTHGLQPCPEFISREEMKAELQAYLPAQTPDLRQLISAGVARGEMPYDMVCLLEFNAYRALVQAFEKCNRIEGEVVNLQEFVTAFRADPMYQQIGQKLLCGRPQDQPNKKETLDQALQSLLLSQQKYIGFYQLYRYLSIRNARLRAKAKVIQLADSADLQSKVNQQPKIEVSIRKKRQLQEQARKEKLERQLYTKFKAKPVPATSRRKSLTFKKNESEARVQYKFVARKMPLYCLGERLPGMRQASTDRYNSIFEEVSKQHAMNSDIGLTIEQRTRELKEKWLVERKLRLQKRIAKSMSCVNLKS